MDITKLINHQDKLNAMTLRELRNIVERFPFYHTARLLYVLNLFKMHEPKLSEELTKASLLIPDRTTLFSLIEGHNYQIDNNSDNKMDIETDENRTISLIDDFLSNLPEDKKETDKVAPHSVPTIADLTSDYAAFLKSQDGLNSDENVTNDGQDSIIDSFIQENKGKQRFELTNKDNEPIGPDYDSDGDYGQIYNENIVNIYIKQGRYQQALEILKTICLNNPEKSTIFASQMRLLETIVNNNKQ